MKKGTAAASSAASDQPAAALARRERARQRDQRAEGQGQRGDHRVREGQREEQVAAQQVGPPVRLGLAANTNEKSVASSVQAGERHGAAAAARGARASARRARTSASAQSVTSKRLIES